jgi:hypothetical protein
MIFRKKTIFRFDFRKSPFQKAALPLQCRFFCLSRGFPRESSCGGKQHPAPTSESVCLGVRALWG